MAQYRGLLLDREIGGKKMGRRRLLRWRIRLTMSYLRRYLLRRERLGIGNKLSLF
jgi:hypothetical protein